MKCKKIRRKLVAYLDGELDRKKRLSVEKHLLECTECRKEVNLLSETFYLLKNQKRITPSESFETELWRRIHSAEKKETAPHFLRRITYIILPAAVAAALIIGVFRENLGERLTPSQSVGISMEEEFLNSIGLDSFQDFPPGSLPHTYFSLTSNTG